jgi:Gpi18-like mannosyltransferase
LQASRTTSLLSKLRAPVPIWLLLGMAIRVMIAPWVGHFFDLRTWMVVGAAVAHGHSPYEYYVVYDYFPHVHIELFGNPSGVLGGIGYPPLWGVLLGSLYDASYAFVHNLYVYTMALKAPVLIGDLAFALLLRKIVTEFSNERMGNIAGAAWFLNPLVILAGTAWGMFDVLPLFFILLSLYTLYKGSWKASALWLAVANEFKPIGVVLILLLCAYLWNRGSPRRALYYVLLTGGAFLALTFGLMVAFGWPISNLVASQTYQVSGVIGAGSLFIVWIAANFVVNGTFPYFIASITGVLWVPAISAVALYYFYRVKDSSFQSLVYWSVITISVSYVARTFVTETQFIIPLTLLLVVELIASESKRLFVGLSAIMAAFLIIHVPISQFLWIGVPAVVSWTTAVSNSPLWGSIRWVSCTILIYAYTVYLFVSLWRMRGVSAPWPWSPRQGRRLPVAGDNP